jgi:hypothetical protein
MSFGVWCPETKTWLETLFGQIQEFHSIPEALEQARELRLNPVNPGETYVVRMIGAHGLPVE